MLQGAASVLATGRFRQRFAACDPGHFRPFQDLWASSIGLGTYLGDADERTDEQYDEAIRAALACGCNILDTAVNYRCQRSERTIGASLDALISEGAVCRDEVILCTKGGYLPFDGEVPPDSGRCLADAVVASGLARPEEIVAGCHCLSPTYLDHALSSSLANLRVHSIDLYYLHNPEQQLDAVDRETFDRRLQRAFDWIEQRTRDGVVGRYGIATWNGFRTHPAAQQYLSLETLLAIAERAGGSRHHFRAIQLPYNLAMPEAWSFPNQALGGGSSMSLLDAAQRQGLSVIASAGLLQGRLARLPSGLARHLPGPFTAAQRSIQFVRSTPGVTAALIGMKRRAHVEENLALARQPLLGRAVIEGVFDRSARSPQ